MNSISIVGNLTADPETSAVGETSVTKFRLAQTEKYKNRAGETKEDTCFVDAEAWGGLGTVISRFASKGKKVAIVGKLAFNQWQGKDGNNRSKHFIRVKEVTLLGSPSGNGNSEPQEDDGGDLPI